MEVEAIVRAHEARIAGVLPDAQVHLTGSCVLGRFDGHDVDLVVLVDDVAAASARLRTVYPPLYEGQWRADWAAFRDPGPPQVDVVATTPGSKGDAHHRRAWELLLADAELRGEYQALKAAGMDSSTKRAFFERVVALLD
jgi:hypothetical protein